MDSDNELHQSVGELRGKLDMLIDSVKEQTEESRRSRAEMHNKIDNISRSADESATASQMLRIRIDVMEPIVQSYSAFKERWKVYAAIGIVIWGIMSGVFVPIIGGLLQTWLQIGG